MLIPIVLIPMALNDVYGFRSGNRACILLLKRQVHATERRRCQLVLSGSEEYDIYKHVHKTII